MFIKYYLGYFLNKRNTPSSAPLTKFHCHAYFNVHASTLVQCKHVVNNVRGRVVGCFCPIFQSSYA